MKLIHLIKRFYHNIVIFALLTNFIAVPIFSASNSNLWIIHTIKRGENMISIAKTYNVTLSELSSWNKISRPNKIYIGQKLRIKKNIVDDTDLKRQSIHFPFNTVSPAENMVIIKRYMPYGDRPNFGIVYKVSGKGKIGSLSTGKVIHIGFIRGYGEYILIDHGKGWHSMYSNLDKLYVREGQFVKAGEKIAETNHSKLFFLLALDGKPVNPVQYVKI